MTKALFIPLRQFTLWLIPQPPPPFVPRDAEKNTQHFQPAARRCETAGVLDRHRPEVAITRLTLPLFSGHLSALMRRCGQSRQCPRFFTVPELLPTEACPGPFGSPGNSIAYSQALSNPIPFNLISFLTQNFKIIVYCIQYCINSPYFCETITLLAGSCPIGAIQILAQGPSSNARETI